jgi:hypothetical protein
MGQKLGNNNNKFYLMQFFFERQLSKLNKKINHIKILINILNYFRIK